MLALQQTGTHLNPKFRGPPGAGDPARAAPDDEVLEVVGGRGGHSVRWSLITSVSQYFINMLFYQSKLEKN